MARVVERRRRFNWVRMRRPVAAGFVVATVLVTRPVLPLFVAGTIAVAAGLVLRVWARGYIRKNLELTTAGPYRLTRNPLYLANLGIILGVVLVAGNLWLALAAGAVFPVLFRHLVVSSEERTLAALFGPEYSAYCRAVPRFISFRALFGRTPPVPATGDFGWRRAGTELFFSTVLALWIVVVGLVGFGADRPVAFELFALTKSLFQ